MSFDDIAQQVLRRVDACRKTRQADTVLDEVALAEADELWRAAQPQAKSRPDPEDGWRLAVAHQALGWLFFLRYVVAPNSSDRLSDLARAVVFCSPLVGSPGAIPGAMHTLLGPEADADQQAALAADLVDEAASNADIMLAEAAIILLTAVLPATAADHPARGWRVGNLGAAYLRRFQCLGLDGDLDRAIELGGLALDTAPPGHPERAGHLAELGRACLVRFERAGVMEDLDRAIELTEQALDAPADHPHQAVRLANLGLAYRRRFERVGTAADLDRAIELTEQALDAAPPDHPERAGHLAKLGDAYLAWFDRVGVMGDLERAIEAREQALAVTPADHSQRAWHLANLGAAYRRRFERVGTVADLDRAIKLAEQAIDAAPEDHADRPGVLSDLAATYRERFERLGVGADLDRAIELGEQALAATPAGHPRQATVLSDLGLACLRWYDRDGAAADLDRAIELTEQALDATPPDHPRRASRLANLELVHKRRFDRFGAESDLERAIEVGGQLVDAISTDHPYRAMHLSDLGRAHQSRFDRLGVAADLDRSIELTEQALDATPTDHPDRPSLLANLGGTYLTRFRHFSAIADLAQGIELTEQAVDLIPAGHPDRPGPMANLATAYQVRFTHVGAAADLDRAIELGEQALAATPAGHPDRPWLLGNLASPYSARFELAGTAADLDRAVELAENALDASPADHPYRATSLANLGRVYWARCERSGQGINRQTLRALAAQAISATTASPHARISATHNIGRLAQALNEHAIALDLFDAAVEMLPLVATREGTWTDQERRLGEQSGLVWDAVAAHCALDDPAGAVEAAELGRGVLLAAQMDTRTDLTNLSQAHPELATRFQRVRDQLNATTGSASRHSAIDKIENRQRIWAEYDELITQIRQYPGYEKFLRPPRLEDLRPTASGGAVVLVNVSRLRGDAVVITSDTDPEGIALPDLVFDDVYAHARELLAATHDSGSLSGILRRQRVLTDVLSWLWDAIVKPVLDALPAVGETGKPPRVWWLPTGLLGLFPLHAAGHPGQPGALDKVVSSYTPTLRALAHTRARPPATARRQLTVALTHTPDLPDLPGTAAEAATLHSLHPGIPPLADQGATIARVRAELPKATWAHFACHAHADLAIPSNSGLRLHDDTLRLPDIIRLHLADAELAYLSACSTAHGGTGLADEALHLASAFQMAGYRHVIASLWPLSDHLAVTAAAAFYRCLPATPTADHAATALHYVTRDLRAEYPDHPDLWAALVHSGA
ncbi:tetratricopeptide (TPR) repeat protein [Kitasatospora sp. MAP12-15]|uniref:CHAT domain-containing protein n=1 Tax=unclassified Kitasatospora TaxID=2633591 RepID=UPI002475A867|nr:CHAT domain-containing protein [Kitasatospora sp. MAP12-44]MDH6109196.1 tetratricopeptide (TPR) repeat protein [Kitasatospora sp. MAP12-44]